MRYKTRYIENLTTEAKLPKNGGFLMLIVLLLLTASTHAGDWKAAATKTIITPDKPMWMAGYAHRDRPADGKLHDLWAKVLVLEDSLGTRSVLVTTDLIGIPREMAVRIQEVLRKKHNLKPAQIILNSSHTHSGPVLKDGNHDYFAARVTKEDIQRIVDHSDRMEEKILTAVNEAFSKLKPAKLSYSNGIARFQVNRRNNKEAELTPETHLNGPNDYAVPVLKVETKDGKPLAIVFGYACHTTVLSGYEWSGDYAGFAQIDIEKEFPGSQAMFFQGAGADQNPLPRRSVELAKQYGSTLAATVVNVAKSPMKPLKPVLKTGFREINLPLAPVPTKEDLLKIEASGNGYIKTWARKMINQIDKGQPLRTSYPHYPIQIWNLDGLNWITMGGEVVVEYALKLKEIFGNETFVMGYSNDMMAYIPSLKILREGGYEGAGSQIYFKDMPAAWDPSIEARIILGIIDLAAELKIPLKYTSIIGN